MNFLLLAIVALILIFGFAAVSNRKAKTPGDGDAHPEAGKGSDEAILQLVKSGNKIAAIKAYRGLHGVGLKEAKDAVELLERDNAAK